MNRYILAAFTASMSIHHVCKYKLRGAHALRSLTLACMIPYFTKISVIQAFNQALHISAPWEHVSEIQCIEEI